MITSAEAEPVTPEDQRTLRERLLAMRSGTPAMREAAERLREHGDFALTRGGLPSKAAAALLERCGCTYGEQVDLF